MSDQTRLTFRDLDRDELLALLDDRPLLCSLSDLLWAKWTVASKRSTTTLDAYIEASKATSEAFQVYCDKRNAKALAAHEAALAKEQRLKVRFERFRRLEKRLYQQHENALEARL